MLRLLKPRPSIHRAFSSAARPPRHDLVSMLYRVRNMNANGAPPTRAVYNDLLACIAHEGLPLEAWAVLDDMSAMDISPDRQSYHHLLHASRWASADAAWDVVHAMKLQGIQPDGQTYAFLIRRATASENLERALQHMHEMENLGLVPMRDNARDVVCLAADLELPKLAIEIAENYEACAHRGLGGEAWMACLASSADMLYADGVKTCWRKVHALKLTPDEGACLSVLQTCARHGLSDLALDVMRVLRTIGIGVWAEQHFAPLIEALCRDGKPEQALRTLDQMRKQCVKPTRETARPLAEYLQRDVDRLDGVWQILDQWRREGNDVDVLVLNAIVEACIACDDLQRAMGAFKSFPDYDCKPTPETFDTLLAGCVAAKHRQLGDKLLLDLKRAAVTPNAKTYEHIVLLCLTQPAYDDAFFYLEEMKTRGFVPSARVYTAIIQTCVAAGDSRYEIALKEMRKCLYTPSPSLQQLLSDYGLVVSRRESVPDSGKENKASRLD